MDQLLGIHWIATTRGTWLHGDARGSWMDGRFIGADPFVEEVARSRMSEPAVVLTCEEVGAVARSFGETCIECKYRVLAATMRPTHSHIVFAPIEESLHTVIARLKRRSAVAVLGQRRARLGDAPASLWTRGQFAVFISKEEHLYNAIQYVQQHNVDAGLPADPYAWIDRRGYSF